MHRLLLLLLLALPLSACAGHYTAGGLLGVDYYMSLDRDPVPGGVPWSLEIVPTGTDGELQLTIDGVDFGTVVAGDEVHIGDDAVVRVNDVVRAPAGG